ncbi:Mba1p [Kluyveromyces lactis]|uniref:KLLA0E23893p n=1 Tax=Kluyveromyces lactis (strain ATCC 8585 / CBS 2359 / DSM 70799 / NBRC 1267 / NRRL Y-1140 / WM37) TaxID=284590 RepID=Q6CM11_KLULA|nr:uncharacterized protein KLLA0_E23893g [Kluyveromyces lactis]CAH00115.1 KLLA0E23893p [Kluyveromyces lactis]|eukprot:XP_455028.1 uncharacterized protein KLLA0_E23893g [Kluyveromyces lactis]
MFQLRGIRTVGLLGKRGRFFSTSRRLLDSDGVVKKPAPFNPRHMGVANQVYIAPSKKNMPNPITSPVAYFNVLVRKIYTLGMNTIQVALFRYQSGLKPNFLLWKNKAIETYVQVNEAFAKRELDTIKPQVSIWVDEALTARAKQIPSNITLDWELIKFNEVPKLVSTQAMMIPGRPVELIQLIYKFDTKQRLIKFDKKKSKTDKLDRDVIDYIAFLCDASTNDILLTGSVFESAPDAKLPKDSETSNQIVIERMKVNGDLFRVQPPVKKD